ncbi:MAG: aminotransferase class IV [Kiritimatiellae bacterium]|nr:aminotransferase class IV [Kiritimatiellia bacterium]
MATAVETQKTTQPARRKPATWTVYMNGKFVPQHEAVVPLGEAGFNVGDGVFDCLRTAAHVPFRLKEHVDRLYRSLKWARIAPGLTPEAMSDICLEVLEKNIPNMAEHDDCWIFIRVTRGGWYRGAKTDFDWPYALKQHPPSVFVYCCMLNFRQNLDFYRNGQKLITSSIRALPAECLDPRLKSLSRQHFMVACAEVQAQDPDAIPLLLDLQGNVAEPYGRNIFFIRDGALMTPSAELVLEGISRQTAMEVAREQDIPVHESAHYKLYDIYNADECFTTSTSYAISPVRSLDGIPIGPQFPGPITMRLLKGFGEKMGIDLIAQAESHL